MTNKAARRYKGRVITLLIVYAAILVAVILWFAEGGPPQGPLRYLAAVLPALPIIGLVVAMGRFVVEQDDEYQRLLLVRQGLVAIGFTLVVATVWGFLEYFEMVPHVPTFWTFIVFCWGLGVGQIWNRVRP